MRIDELTRPKDIDPILTRAGYERLGSGNFATVYQKPGSNYVLKVFTSEDTGYTAFLDLVKKSQSNPHFPKIYGKIIRINSECLAVRMEPLTPNFDNNAAEYIDTYISTWGKHVHKTAPNYNAVMEAWDFMDLRPSLIEACDLIVKHLLPRYRLDIKDENVMMRGETLIITDPIWDASSTGAGNDATKWDAFPRRPST